MKRTIILAIITFVLGLIIGLAIHSLNPTSQTISEVGRTYTYTKAICNEDQCVDVHIECQNGEVASITPISDFKQIQNHEIQNSNLCN